MFRTCFSTKQEGIVTVPGERASSAPTPSWAQTRKQIFSQAFLTSTNVLAFLASLRARLLFIIPSTVRVNFHCHHLLYLLVRLVIGLSSSASAVKRRCALSHWISLHRLPSLRFAIGRHSHVVVPFAFRQFLIFHLSLPHSLLLETSRTCIFRCILSDVYSLGSCLGSQIFLFVILHHPG